MLTPKQLAELRERKAKVRLKIGPPVKFLDSVFANYPTRFARAFRAGLQTAYVLTAILGVFLVLLLFLIFVVEQPGLVPTVENKFTWDGVSAVTLGIVAIWSTCYWNLDAIFGKQWGYCADLFNECKSTEGKELRLYMQCCLMSDIIDTKLWAHETFAEFFRSMLELAIDYHGDPTIISNFKANKLTLEEAQYALMKFADACEQRADIVRDMAKEEPPLQPLAPGA